MTTPLELGDFTVDLFEKAALAYPDQTCLQYEDGPKMTYGEVLLKVDHLSSQLYELLAPAPGSPTLKAEDKPLTPMVCLMHDRHFGIIIAMLSILKCGAAYVPVDPAFPAERQSYIFGHSKCSVVVVDEPGYDNMILLGVEIPPICIVLEATTGKLLKLYKDKKLVDVKQKQALEAGKRPPAQFISPRHEDSLQYVLYTSGSTGKPKGVMVKHFGVRNIIKYFVDTLKVGLHTSIMSLTTFCFDISVLELYVGLTSGATVVLCKSSTQKDPFRAVEIMETYGVTIFQATPTTYEMLLASGWEGDEKVDFLVGGEAIRPTVYSIADNCRSFTNVYGPTETTIWSSAFTLPKNACVIYEQEPVPIGAPIYNTTFNLVHPAEEGKTCVPLVKVPDGQEGELCIGGVGVAMGYAHAPDITADKFLPNPFGDGWTTCCYRTGDIVAKKPDGNYVFVRRADAQVKIDGYRIELGEIESQFNGCPEVDKAVCLVRQNKLVMWIKPTDLQSIKKDKVTGELSIPQTTLDSIFKKASLSLTYYMIPKFTVVVEVFPVSPAGKLDTKSLVDPPALMPKAEAPKVKKVAVLAVKEGETQTMSSLICSAIEDYRGVRPAVNASVGSFGLDSLGTVMLAGQIKNRLGMVVKPAEIMKASTIYDLAETLYARTPQEIKDKLHLVEEEPIDENSEPPEVDHFGVALAGCVDLFMGLRGVFTIMVLYDHYENGYLIAAQWEVDTTLFVLIAGYTTHVQLRKLPQWVGVQTDGLIVRVEEGFSADPSGGGIAEETLGEKPAFDFWNYLFLKFVGLFPIFWLSMIIHIPYWVWSNNNIPGIYPTIQMECMPAFITGIWTITFNLCSWPDLKFVSNFWFAIIFYGLIRWGINRRMMSSIKQFKEDGGKGEGEKGGEVTTFGVTDSVHDLVIRTKKFKIQPSLCDKNRSWSDFMGIVNIYLTYNFYHRSVMFYCFITFVPLTMLIYLQNAFILIKYWNFSWFFFGAALTAILNEQWMNGNFTVPLKTPWWNYANLYCAVKPEEGQDYDAVGGFPDALMMVNDGKSERSRRSSKAAPAPQEVEPMYAFLWQAWLYFWFWLPDLIFLCLSILCSHLYYGRNRNHDPANTDQWINNIAQDLLIPAGVLLYIFVCVQQVGDHRDKVLMSKHNLMKMSEKSKAHPDDVCPLTTWETHIRYLLYVRRDDGMRMGLSRLLLESGPLRFLGWICYPAYVLQYPILGYYCSYIFPAQPRPYIGGLVLNFATQPLGNRFMGILLILFPICALVQYFFQDRFVMFLVNKFMSWKAGRNKNTE